MLVSGAFKLNIGFLHAAVKNVQQPNSWHSFFIVSILAQT